MNEFKKLFSLALEELDIAKLLLERAHYRASICRSYYSMYYAAQASLLSENIDTATHKGLIRLFSLHEAEMLLEKAKTFVAEVERILNEQ
jgi:uncharacterized protein (UPF0332 family)